MCSTLPNSHLAQSTERAFPSFESFQNDNIRKFNQEDKHNMGAAEQRKIQCQICPC